MGKRVQAIEETDSQGNGTILGDNPQPYCSKASRRPGESIDSVKMADMFACFIEKKFSHLSEMFNRLTDHRNKWRCRYTSAELIWSVLLMYLCRAGSRNKIDSWRNDGVLPSVLMEIAGRNLLGEAAGMEPLITSSDNVAIYLGRLNPSELESLLVELVKMLIDSRLFDDSRLNSGEYLIVVDGSVREKCRKRFTHNGLKRGEASYHYVLRADILLNGHCIPLMHEHIDMNDPEQEKEDCEINAAKRLFPRLKKAFPRLPIMVLGDALYACRPIAELSCQQNWEYCFTFKQGRTSAVWQEAMSLLDLSPQNKMTYEILQDGPRNKRYGQVRWVENVDFSDPTHKNLVCSVLEQKESFRGEINYYAWISSKKNITQNNVLQLIQSTGRKRHTVEDQLNSQKNNGYGLEHVFCANKNAGKNYYTIMQIAVLLWTLFYQGLLKRTSKWARTWSQEAIAMMLREGLAKLYTSSRTFKFGQLRFVT